MSKSDDLLNILYFDWQREAFFDTHYMSLRLGVQFGEISNIVNGLKRNRKIRVLEEKISKDKKNYYYKILDLRKLVTKSDATKMLNASRWQFELVNIKPYCECKNPYKNINDSKQMKLYLEEEILSIKSKLLL